MGLIRGVLTVIVSVILLLSLFLTANFLNFSLSLEYNTIKDPAKDFAKNVLNETSIWQEITDNFLVVEHYCSTHYNYIIDEQGFYADIPCEKVEEGSDVFLDNALENLIYNIYYDSYSCDFWECVKQANYPVVLLSEKAKDYWNTKYKQALIISLIAFALLFLFIKKKAWAFILTGLFMIVAGFLFRNFNWFFSLLPNFSFFNVIDLFFLKSNFVFAIFLIIGIVMFVLGILFRIFGIGLKISHFFKKKEKPLTEENIKKIFKQELKEEKKEKTSKKKDKIKKSNKKNKKDS